MRIRTVCVRGGGGVVRQSHLASGQTYPDPVGPRSVGSSRTHRLFGEVSALVSAGRPDALPGRPFFAMSTSAASSVARKFPMLVLPISKALTLDAFPKHEDIIDQLVEYDGHSCVVFFSHTWLSWKHPDSATRPKWRLLKGLLRNALRGELEVVPHWAVWMMRVINAGVSSVKWRLHYSKKQMQ